MSCVQVRRFLEARLQPGEEVDEQLVGRMTGAAGAVRRSYSM